MRTLLLGLLATVTAATMLHSTNLSHRPVNPIASADIGYRFYDHFCRVQYNNPADRNACMMGATGTLLPNSERDDR